MTKKNPSPYAPKLEGVDPAEVERFWEREIALRLRGVRDRVAATCAVPRERISITHDHFGQAGDAFTITVTFPPADRRVKQDSKLHGTGDTLAEAERELGARFEAHRMYEEQEAERRKKR